MCFVVVFVNVLVNVGNSKILMSIMIDLLRVAFRRLKLLLIQVL